MVLCSPYLCSQKKKKKKSEINVNTSYITIINRTVELYSVLLYFYEIFMLIESFAIVQKGNWVESYWVQSFPEASANFNFTIGDWRMDSLYYLHGNSIRDLSARTDRRNLQKLIWNVHELESNSKSLSLTYRINNWIDRVGGNPHILC